jgi:HEAT repeat protein
MMTNSKPMLASEFMARLETDPERARIAAAAQAERDARSRQLSEARRPLLEDLAARGVHIRDPWNIPSDIPPAAYLPTFLDYLERGSVSASALEPIARAFVNRPIAAYWDRLVRLYKNEQDWQLRDAIAIALARGATKRRVPELMDLVREGAGEDSRLFFLKPIIKLAGTDGVPFVASFTGDEGIGKEATALVKRAHR